jgi:hypothetical protein
MPNLWRVQARIRLKPTAGDILIPLRSFRYNHDLLWRSGGMKSNEPTKADRPPIPGAYLLCFPGWKSRTLEGIDFLGQ